MAAVARGAKMPGAASTHASQLLLRAPASSLRFKPFTAVAPRLRPGCIKRGPSSRRVAEVEDAAPADDLDLSFNYADSKKNNVYELSDIEAALRYYFDGAGQLLYEEDHVVNYSTLTEDAGFFDDIDNNEGYEQDEYASAGIPEAAPKKRRQGQGQGGGEEQEEDDAADEKSQAFLDKVVVDEELQYLEDEALDAKGPWDWDEGADDVDYLVDRAVAIGESEILNELPNTDLQELDDESRELTEFVTQGAIEEFPVEDIDLSEDGPEDEVADPTAAVLTEEDEQRIDALLAEADELTMPEVDMDDFDFPELSPIVGALDESQVMEYVEQLRARGSDSNGIAEEELNQLLEGVEEKPEVVAIEDSDDAEEGLLEDDEEDLTLPEEVLADLALPTIEKPSEDFERELEAISAAYNELEAIGLQKWEEEDMPTDQDLETLDAYVDYANELYEKSGTEDVEDVVDEDDMMAMDHDELDETLVASGIKGEMDAGEEEEEESNYVERILELSRVTKVVKGGKLMGFRCVAVVGNLNGKVGVGCSSGREIVVATKRALIDAKKNMITVPLVGSGTIPHKTEVKFKAARCVILPAADGTGVIAGGAIRSVLELAGVQNCLAKRLGTRSTLNNARCAVKALQELRTLSMVSKARDLPMEYLMS